MEFPRRRRIFPISFGVTKITAGATDYFRFAIAIDVRECRRFVVHDIEDGVLLPMPLAATRIFVPGSFFARKRVGENVCPTVMIEVVSESEKVVGVGIVGTISAFES